VDKLVLITVGNVTQGFGIGRLLWIW